MHIRNQKIMNQRISHRMQIIRHKQVIHMAKGCVIANLVRRLKKLKSTPETNTLKIDRTLQQVKYLKVIQLKIITSLRW